MVDLRNITVLDDDIKKEPLVLPDLRGVVALIGDNIDYQIVLVPRWALKCVFLSFAWPDCAMKLILQKPGFWHLLSSPKLNVTFRDYSWRPAVISNGEHGFGYLVLLVLAGEMWSQVNKNPWPFESRRSAFGYFSGFAGDSQHFFMRQPKS